MILGLDLDNTIIDYGSAAKELAVEMGLIPSELSSDKNTVRDFIRHSPAGDLAWRHVQARLYGSDISRATLTRGWPSFAKFCRERAVSPVVVSHKTQFSNLGGFQDDFRKRALNWLTERDFFSESGPGLSPKDIYFFDTQEEKLMKIKELRCTHFVDDLPEIFAHPQFPSSVKKILFSTETQAGVDLVAANWEIVSEFLRNDTSGN